MKLIVLLAALVSAVSSSAQISFRPFTCSGMEVNYVPTDPDVALIAFEAYWSVPGPVALMVQKNGGDWLFVRMLSAQGVDTVRINDCSNTYVNLGLDGLSVTPFQLQLPNVYPVPNVDEFVCFPLGISTGISETSGGPPAAWPNPFTDVFMLRSSPGEAWRIIASDGQVLAGGTASGISTVIDGSSWASGIYLVAKADGYERIVKY